MDLFLHLAWSGGAIILAAVVIGWGAETAQIYISQGLALAILAWLQTSPEFAVEALIAWQQKTTMMVANLTGSLRLLVGLGWPLVYFTSALFRKKEDSLKGPLIIKLSWVNGLEILVLILSTTYFLLVWLKGSLTIGDSVFLIGIYALYIVQLARQSKMRAGESAEGHDDLPWVGRKVAKLKSPVLRALGVAFIFVVGGILLKLATSPFLESLEAVAVSFGMSSFYFVQWCAPLASEFPEKVTAFNWARTVVKSPMALLNMMGSNIVQWTVMAGMVPVIYSISRGEASAVFFDKLQSDEIILTIVQSYLGILFLMDLELSLDNALGLLALWAIQFFIPTSRHVIIYVYLFWGLIEMSLLVRRKKLFFALKHYREMSQRVSQKR